MSTEENKSVARRFFEDMVNAGDLAVADEILASGFLQHPMPPEFPPGREGFKEFVRSQVSQGLSDLRVNVEDMIAEGGTVAVRVSVQATHQGPVRGYPGTGKPVTFTGMDFFRVAGGKIHERWAERDFLGLLEQSGAISPPEPTAR